MFTYRIHRVAVNYQLQYLHHLHKFLMLSHVPSYHQNQMFIRSNSRLKTIATCVECFVKSATHLCSLEASLLRIVTGLSNADIYPQISRVMTEQAHYREVFALQEAEEYNRVVVLTLARAMHINGSRSPLKQPPAIA